MRVQNYNTYRCKQFLFLLIVLLYIHLLLIGTLPTTYYNII